MKKVLFFLGTNSQIMSGNIALSHKLVTQACLFAMLRFLFVYLCIHSFIHSFIHLFVFSLLVLQSWRTQEILLQTGKRPTHGMSSDLAACLWVESKQIEFAGVLAAGRHLGISHRRKGVWWAARPRHTGYWGDAGRPGQAPDCQPWAGNEEASPAHQAKVPLCVGLSDCQESYAPADAGVPPRCLHEYRCLSPLPSESCLSSMCIPASLTAGLGVPGVPGESHLTLCL